MSTSGNQRRSLEEMLRVADLIDSCARLDSELRHRISQTAGQLKSSDVIRKLADIPLDAMRDAAEIPLRLNVLPAHGITSVASVYLAERHTLERISGVSAVAALELKSIAEEMYAAVEAATPLAFPSQQLSRTQLVVLQQVRAVEQLRQAVGGRTVELKLLARDVEPVLQQARAVSGKLRWYLTGRTRRTQVVGALTDLVAMAVQRGLVPDAAHLEAGQSIAALAEPADTLWEDFRRRSSDYYAVLEAVLGAPSQMGQRHFDQDLLDRILGQDVDHSLVNATLRRYQVFGVQFALAQARVIIGDEMGLGKTMQALAVLAHRWRDGATHFLVVVPASVLVNWERETGVRTSIPVTKIHGETQRARMEFWAGTGGIGLTTFDTLKAFDVSDDAIRQLPIDTVVVDEAHYVKNPDSARARQLARWVSNAPRALFLTGTPLENRVDEFVHLVTMLDKDVAHRLNRVALVAGADSFRRQAAVVYLRRNAAEVLTELPDLVEIDEYCTWDGADYNLYLDGVTAGNLMAMRRAAMRPAIVGRPTNKLARLLEITSEAFASGQKVLIYSFFRDVLDEVMRALGPQALGPITGDVPPSTRQKLVDEFTTSSEPRALVGQIQAAGTGLNIQAASVVILCEPQVKPSLEVQAIARAHRMGQVRKVQVHRLMIPESVDSLMAEIVARKQEEFDIFAAVSELAESAPDSKDNREFELAQVIVLAERRRLGITRNT